MTRKETGDIGPLLSADVSIDEDAKLGEGQLIKGLPFSGALQMRLHVAAKGVAILSVPYDPSVVGDPRTGVMHGGVITALLDTACGSAVMASDDQRRGRLRSTATLDLRIDYMRPARPEVRVLARAECYRMTRSVGFARAVAYQEREGGSDIVASAAGAFILDRAAEEKTS